MRTRGINYQAIAMSAVMLTVIGGFGAQVSAERYSGGSYVIDASVLGNSFGNDMTGGSYKLTSSGGESIIGQGSGGSYRLDSGYVAQLPRSMQLTVQPSGLVAYYPLNENQGTTSYDYSANGNNAILQSGAGWTTGKINQALNVNATAEARVADNAALPTGQNMTVEVWAYQNSIATGKALVSQWDYAGGTPTSGSWAFQTNDTVSDSLRFFVANAANDPGNNYVSTPGSAWSAGGWHHAVATYDGTQSAANRVKIYIDGVVQSTAVTGTISTTLVNSSGFLDIGDFYGLSGRKFNGAVDEVKIFNRTLSDYEVKAEYDAQSAGTPSGLHLGLITPNTSNTALFDAIIQTDALGYTLGINQNQNLTNGGNTIAPIGSSIASPAAWSEGTTKGLGFSLVSSNATAIDGKWSAGAAYAPLPGSATSVYSRTGTQSTKDILSMKLRADVTTAQVSGTYSNIVTVTGTYTP